MRVVLVFFEKISKNQKTGFGYVSYSLAKRLHEAGHLEGVICLAADGGLDIPEEKITALSDGGIYKFLNWVLAKISQFFPVFDSRLMREVLFDKFICGCLDNTRGDMAFFSRPLFLNASKKAKSAGMDVWIQSSIPHPMTNYALVRNEEMRLGLKKHGAYTNVSRAERLTKTLASADKVISLGPAIGRYTFDTYTKMLGPDKVLPLENIFSISVDEFTGLAGNRTPREETDEITFLHVSHINLIKGIPYLLDAWRSFQERSMTSCRLVLVGSADKNILDLLEQDYSDLAGFEYRGFMPNLVEAYSYGDVFVSPSISDNGPGTIVEAMAAGMPVISSRNCGLSSLVTEGENGFTYEYNDTEKLTQALIWFANNRHMICDMGRNARQTAENLTGDHYADEILEHVEKLSKMEPEASDSKPMG